MPEQLNQELEVYPNPVSGNQIQVKLDKKYKDQQYAISLKDMHGCTLIQRDYFQKGYLISIDIAQIPKRVYLLNLKSDNLDQTFKLLVN